MSRNAPRIQTMTFRRRALLGMMAGLTLAPGRLLAAEAAPMAAGFGEAGLLLLEGRLRREGYALLGDVRRKGPLVIITASRANASWRLVMDSRSGEIIGRRPMGGIINPAD
jgi:hypothetical protein